MKPEVDLFTILPEDKIPEKGKILISEPFLPDTFFNRTIVYLADHNSEGSVGFILNKKLDIRVCDAVSGFDRCKEYLSMGGPVSPDTLHYLHNQGERIPNSVSVNDNIYWGGRH
jgi:putative transcriptional regulator